MKVILTTHRTGDYTYLEAQIGDKKIGRAFTNDNVAALIQSLKLMSQDIKHNIK